MRLMESIKNSRIAKSITKRLMEFTSVPARGQVDDDEHLYRPLTDDQRKRDLLPLTQERMQNIAVHLYEATPMGKRLMELNRDFIIGEGIKYTAEDEGVKKVMDNFWHDPINNWEISQYEKALELSLFGEQFYPVWVNPYDGSVKLGYIDPTLVKKITRNPLNPKQLIEVILNRSLKPVTGKDDVPGMNKDRFKIIDFDRQYDSGTYGKLSGEIFYFSVNKLSNGTRGRSDLLPLADWIDVHERFLFNIAERAKLLSAFIWDITFKGFNDKQIKDWVKLHGLKVPKPGSTRYHNENIDWKAVTPKLESSDMSEHASTIKNHIASGFGVPPHWLGEGEKVTRATALVMNSPSYKHFKSKQFYFKYIIKFIFNFVIDQSIIAGKLEPDVNRNFSIIMQPLAEKDFAEVAGAMAEVSTALQMAVDNDWITDQQARDFFAHVSSQMGIELNVSGNETQKKEKDYTPEQQEKLKKELDKNGNTSE